MARGVEIGKGEPWGKFIELANGRPSFARRPTALCHQIRKLRQAIALGLDLAAGGEGITDSSCTGRVIWRQATP